MRYFITGGAGFIGSNMVDRLLAMGEEVVVYDNLSTGFLEFIESHMNNRKFRFIQGDLMDLKLLTASMEDSEFVFHFAANADVRFGLDHPKKDVEQNIVVTFHVLEAMRANNVLNIAFSSTGSIYGESKVVPTPEDAPFPMQTSLYGASKLAGEGLLAAYAEGYNINVWIFRFVSILGERYTHGHVFDFYRKLLHDPNKLHVLGDGNQKKSYLYIEDCIDAILLTIKKARDKVNIFNLGTDEYSTVNQSIEWITEYLGLQPALEYAGGERGWIGDNPFIYLDTTKIRQLGWTPKLTIKDSIIRTVEFLVKNRSVLERRG